MPVIINEFEIIPDDPQATQPAPGEGPEAATPAVPTLTPADVEAIVQHQCERELRLRAH